MYEYLISYVTPEGNHHSKVMSIAKLACLLSHDASYFKNLRVWRMLPEVEPQRVTVLQERRRSAMWYTLSIADNYGNIIESTKCPL